jgi:hypothetical protein
MKFEPWSDWMDFGRPTKVKNFVSACTMVLALIFRSGIASGKRVETHIIVSKYWLPRLVLGNGPTQSIIIRLNGSSKAGIGFSGAFGIT